MCAICSECNSIIKLGEQYRYLSTILCENCYLDKRTSHVRKTHWQYLKSIKTDYLRPGKMSKGRLILERSALILRLYLTPM